MEKDAGIKGRIQLAAHRKCRCFVFIEFDSYWPVSVCPVSFTISSNINAEVQILQRTVCSKVESRNTRRHIGRSTSRSVYYCVGNLWKKEMGRAKLSRSKPL